jgi:hypothetical protein
MHLRSAAMVDRFKRNEYSDPHIVRAEPSSSATPESTGIALKLTALKLAWQRLSSRVTGRRAAWRSIVQARLLTSRVSPLSVDLQKPRSGPARVTLCGRRCFHMAAWRLCGLLAAAATALIVVALKQRYDAYCQLRPLSWGFQRPPPVVPMRRCADRQSGRC